MPVSAIFWLVALVVFAVLEAATAALVSIWFIVGSLGALVVVMLGGGVWPQVLVFLGLSIAVLIIGRPLIKKHIAPKKVSTNADRYIGTTAVVTERIDNVYATGAVKVSGVEWTARAEDARVIESGSLVTVSRIEGAKLYVSLQQSPEPAAASSSDNQ